MLVGTGSREWFRFQWLSEQGQRCWRTDCFREAVSDWGRADGGIELLEASKQLRTILSGWCYHTEHYSYNTLVKIYEECFTYNSWWWLTVFQTVLFINIYYSWVISCYRVRWYWWEIHIYWFTADTDVYVLSIYYKKLMLRGQRSCYRNIKGEPEIFGTVSYTHLTLPTNREV